MTRDEYVTLRREAWGAHRRRCHDAYVAREAAAGAIPDGPEVDDAYAVLWERYRAALDASMRTFLAEKASLKARLHEGR